MKYCIRQDRPLTGLAGGDQFHGGCEIYGVHHDCVGCPNLMDMGDGSYSATTVADNTMVQEDRPKTPAEKIHAAVQKLRQGLPWGACAAQLSLEANCKDEAYSEVLSIVDAILELAPSVEKYEYPGILVKDSIEVTSRMAYIKDEMKPIAEFLLNYAYWDLHKDIWGQPTVVVPVFRVLDAIAQEGKPYCGIDEHAL